MLASLKASPAATRARTKLVLATDGIHLEAENLRSGETVARRLCLTESRLMRRELCEVVSPDRLLKAGYPLRHHLGAVASKKLVFFSLEILGHRIVLVGRRISDA